MSNSWDKWAKRPTPELVSRLIDLTSQVLSLVDEDELNLQSCAYDDPAYIDADGNAQNTEEGGIEGLCNNVEEYTSEAHWIAEELEHRIRKTEYAGLCDIQITGNKKKRRRRRGPSGGGSGGGTLAYPES